MRIRLIKLIIRRINLLCKKSSRIRQGQLKLIKINCRLGFPVYPTSLLAQTVHPRVHMGRGGPSPLLASAARRRRGSKCPSASQAHCLMQRNVPVLSNEQSKRAADFISSSRWVGDFHVLTPNHFLARRGPGSVFPLSCCTWPSATSEVSSV